MITAGFCVYLLSISCPFDSMKVFSERSDDCYWQSCAL